ncbi:MAG: hypothetical protein M1819_007102 [Sarea resinae]|nr:MAG: hypothetical protein M1819_007102 [Sarea resinae]
MFNYGRANSSSAEAHRRSKSQPTTSKPSKPSKLPHQSTLFELDDPEQNNFDDILLAPEPVFTARPPRGDLRSHQSEDLTQTSYSNCRLPPLIRAGFPINSPPRSPTKDSFVPTLTGDQDGKIKLEEKVGKFAWFKGTSAPISLGLLPLDEPRDSPAMIRPANKMRSNTTVARPALTGSASRFSFFGPKTKVSDSPASDDEFLTLDIDAALFPGGPADPFSPASFRNLLDNAEALLLRMQTAYKLRTEALHEVTAEKSAQEEELEEAETRARHLKIQLDGMAEKVAEQERSLKAMAAELAEERRRRCEEEQEYARQRTVMLVKTTPPDNVQEETCMTALPLRNTKRESRASDSGFESEDDGTSSSSAESIFSRARSSTGTVTSQSSAVSSALCSPDLAQQSQPHFPSVTSAPQYQSSLLPPYHTSSPLASRIRPGMPPPQRSTFEKILKGMHLGQEDSTAGCGNCRGGTAATAWGVVSSLREENRGLHARVANLEETVEDCLDLVRGGGRV